MSHNQKNSDLDIPTVGVLPFQPVLVDTFDLDRIPILWGPNQRACNFNGYQPPASITDWRLFEQLNIPKVVRFVYNKGELSDDDSDDDSDGDPGKNGCQGNWAYTMQHYWTVGFTGQYITNGFPNVQVEFLDGYHNPHSGAVEYAAIQGVNTMIGAGSSGNQMRNTIIKISRAGTTLFTGSVNSAFAAGFFTGSFSRCIYWTSTCCEPDLPENTFFGPHNDVETDCSGYGIGPGHNPANDYTGPPRCWYQPGPSDSRTPVWSSEVAYSGFRQYGTDGYQPYLVDQYERCFGPDPCGAKPSGNPEGQPDVGNLGGFQELQPPPPFYYDNGA